MQTKKNTVFRIDLSSVDKELNIWILINFVCWSRV